jgi:hypothetical protein
MSNDVDHPEDIDIADVVRLCPSTQSVLSMLEQRLEVSAEYDWFAEIKPLEFRGRLRQSLLHDLRAGSSLGDAIEAFVTKELHAVQRAAGTY